MAHRIYLPKQRRVRNKMPRTGTFQFGLPRFKGAVREIVILSIGIWVLVLLLWTFARWTAIALLLYGGFDPGFVLRGWVWQFFTYGVIHQAPGHIFATMLGVYFIGSSVEERVGKKAFYELYLTSLVGAALLGFLLSFTHHVAQGAALGAGAADNALLMIFYLFYRGASIYLFPFPFQLPVKWVVVIFGAIEAGYWVYTDFSLFYTVHLLGLGMGYIWYKYMWRRATMSVAIENRVFSLRNAYYRWKRRRAGKKFQVYMKKHQQDPKQYFDEYGNFRPPDDPEKKNGGSKGGWVN